MSAVGSPVPGASAEAAGWILHVVGGSGDPTRPRRVVATASYEARAFGVRSGLPPRPPPTGTGEVRRAR